VKHVKAELDTAARGAEPVEEAVVLRLARRSKTRCVSQNTGQPKRMLP
jgi:hypothetical protein